MEEQGYIELRVENYNKTLTPQDVDIREIASIISDIEAFLYPTREEKKLRPHIAYDIEAGSARHKFFLPISAVLLFNGLVTEINKRGDLSFLDYKRQEVISRFQKRASTDGYSIEFNSSLTTVPLLVINSETSYEMSKIQYVESEFYLYGEIYQEGGKNPNIHISTTQYGNLAISATKNQILDGKKKTYKPYGVKVRGKKNLVENGKLSDLSLIEFIDYRPVFDRTLLDKAIAKASVNLSKIKDVDAWIETIKVEGI
ncbi:hypothetical protein [Myroides phaeus]|uniref:hypothetical protein n=1 Tax=Myroides phaeus TaxID=702745 RepID=UPI0013037CE0|nr:hypothetical protein [Myroides phaeus]